MNTMLLMFLYYINMSFCAFFKCWERSRSDIKTLKAVLPKRRSWERFLTIEKRSHVTFQERSTIENVRSKRERSQGGLIVKTSSNENDDQLYSLCLRFLNPKFRPKNDILMMKSECFYSLGILIIKLPKHIMYLRKELHEYHEVRKILKQEDLQNWLMITKLSLPSYFLLTREWLFQKHAYYSSKNLIVGSAMDLYQQF